MLLYCRFLAALTEKKKKSFKLELEDEKSLLHWTPESAVKDKLGSCRASMHGQLGAFFRQAQLWVQLKGDQQKQAAKKRNSHLG